jgi:hypothetical protein
MKPVSRVLLHLVDAIFFGPLINCMSARTFDCVQLAHITELNSDVHRAIARSLMHGCIFEPRQPTIDGIGQTVEVVVAIILDAPSGVTDDEIQVATVVGINVEGNGELIYSECLHVLNYNTQRKRVKHFCLTL